MVYGNFNRFNDFTSKGENFRLTFGGYESANTAFDGAGEGGHKVFVVKEFERHAFNGFFIRVGNGEQQHRAEIHIGLVHGNGLKIELDGAILNGNTAVYGFY